MMGRQIHRHELSPEAVKKLNKVSIFFQDCSLQNESSNTQNQKCKRGSTESVEKVTSVRCIFIF